MNKCVAVVLSVGLGAATLGAGEAAAEPMIGDPAAGREFALERCMDCHMVSPEQGSVVLTEAPPFAAVAADPKTTALSLRVFLRSPHINMPNFILTETETDDVIAYILSLDPDAAN